MSAKSHIVRRIVVLHDVHEFVVSGAEVDCDAKRKAEALIEAISKDEVPSFSGVKQIRCDTIDVGESATWHVTETTKK